ncbi:MAG: hypothetical protein WCI37_01050 [bacterium]|jgi:hypothetical protein
MEKSPANDKQDEQIIQTSEMLVYINGDSKVAEKLEIDLNEDNNPLTRSIKVIGNSAINSTNKYSNIK